MRLGYIDFHVNHVSAQSVMGTFIRGLSKYEDIRIIDGNTFRDVLLDIRNFNSAVNAWGQVLKSVQRQHKIEFLIAPSPTFVEYHILLLARARMQVDIRFVLFVHTVIPQWISWLLSAPLVLADDFLYVSSNFSRRCIAAISQVFHTDRVIPLCVDVDLGLPATFKDSRKIIYLGRLHPSKNIHELIRIVPQLSRQIPGVQLDLIGPIEGRQVDADYIMQLFRLRHRLGAESCVRFRGLLTGPEKYETVSTGSVFAYLGTALEETFGHAIIEALHCGLPVICSDWDGFRDIVDHGTNGYRVPVLWPKDGMWPILDIKQTYETFCSVLADSEKLQRMQQAALASARQYHSSQVIPIFLDACSGRAIRENHFVDMCPSSEEPLRNLVEYGPQICHHRFLDVPHAVLCSLHWDYLSRDFRHMFEGHAPEHVSEYIEYYVDGLYLKEAARSYKPMRGTHEP